MGDVYNYGAINSPIDDRDYVLDSLVTSSGTGLPASYRTETTVPVFSQGSVGCCVACALAACRYIQEEMQEGSATQFSVNYIYGNRREYDDQREGMIPRQALNTLLDFGDCHWNDFTGYEHYCNLQSKYKANKAKYDELAYPYKINSYYRLYSEEEIKTAVYKLGCALVIYDVTSSLEYPNNPSKGYVKYNPEAEILGQHALTIVGWTEDNYWIVLNSWGEDYGLNGYCYIPFDYPINEAWTMVDDYRYRELIFDRDLEKVSGVFLGIKKNRPLA